MPYRPTDVPGDIQMDLQHTNALTHIWTDVQPHKCTGGHMYVLLDVQMDRHTDRCTDRQPNTPEYLRMYHMPALQDKMYLCLHLNVSGFPYLLLTSYY